MWGFPKSGVSLVGVHIERIVAFGALLWGPCIPGNYHRCVLPPPLTLSCEPWSPNLTNSFNSAPAQDKAQVRARGIVDRLTNQPVKGRKNLGC